MAAQKRAVLIAGPTASGKSALALARARELGALIVNADALQVYEDLCVLTARPTAAETAFSDGTRYAAFTAAGFIAVGLVATLTLGGRRREDVETR